MNKSESDKRSKPTSRRTILKASLAVGASAVLGGLPRWAMHSAYANEGPEQSSFNFGFIALTDCSPMIVAHEKGFFKKYGVNATPVKPANWAAVRDALIKGDTHCTHMLLGMPIASSMGLMGAVPKPMVIPWLLNRNGQAITLKKEWKGKVAADPKVLKPMADEAKAKGEKLTFAMTFPPGTHAMWMRYYLGAGGIDPDRDVQLITIPPPQMVANMKVDKMDGFCVGEPWNFRAIQENVGYTAMTTQELWPDHPEKVCAFTEEFVNKNPKTVKAILKGLNDASVWLDDMGNRPEQCEIVSKNAYINCPKDQILARLQGKLDYGDGRPAREDDHYMHFSKRNCNYPQPKYAKWWLTQFRRWGMVEGAPDYEGVAKKVMRGDLYEEAMKEIGYAHSGASNEPETLFDGVKFDPTGDLEAYAKGFAVTNLKG
ncbi:MAG: ABC transporter substrate-binding protein [Burkholderiales bacterium]|nr:ABC transporter substrate-binding protein [Phycisphaerae bacterium]